MARYYFDICDGQFTTRDKNGAVFSSFLFAFEYATRIAGEILEEYKDVRGHIEIRRRGDPHVDVLLFDALSDVFS